MKKCILFLSALTCLMMTSACSRTLPFEKGMITFRFDDANRTQIPFIHKLNAAGIPAVIFAIAGADSAPYMDTEELAALQAAGNEIGCHSMTHARLLFCGKESHAWEVSAAADLLRAEGLKITSFAWPYGMKSPLYSGQVQDAFVQAASYPLLFKGSLNSADTDPYSIDCVEAAFENDPESLMENAAGNRLWLVLTFHWTNQSWTKYSVSTEQTEKILSLAEKYIKEGKLKPVTLHHGAALLKR